MRWDWAASYDGIALCARACARWESPVCATERERYIYRRKNCRWWAQATTVTPVLTIQGLCFIPVTIVDVGFLFQNWSGLSSGNFEVKRVNGKKLKSGEYNLMEKKYKLKVKYGNHFVKCEFQLYHLWRHVSSRVLAPPLEACPTLPYPMASSTTSLCPSVSHLTDLLQPPRFWLSRSPPSSCICIQ